jgi:hypothetical protein
MVNTQAELMIFSSTFYREKLCRECTGPAGPGYPGDNKDTPVYNYPLAPVLVILHMGNM